MSGWDEAPDPWGVGTEYHDKAWSDGFGTAEEEIGQIGEVCEVKDRYAELDLHGVLMKWLDVKPFGVDQETALKNKRLRDIYAIVCGHYPCSDGTWELRTIWINNPTLNSAICKVFKDHLAKPWDKPENLEFTTPFVPLVQRWEQLCKLAVDDKGSELQKLMDLFVEMLKIELRGTLQRVKKIKQTGFSSFYDLQFVFEPGKLFVRSDPLDAGISWAYSFGQLSVNQIKSNGIDYGVERRSWHLRHFEGTRRLADLDVRPFWACDKNDAQAIKSALIRRGRLYEELVQNMHLRFNVATAQEYQPETDFDIWEHSEAEGWTASDWGETQQRTKDDPKASHLPIQMPEGRVIVDEAGYYKLENKDNGLDSFWYLTFSDVDCIETNSTESPDDKAKNHDHRSEQGEQSSRLTDDQRMIAVSTVRCFSLEMKTWCNIEIEDLAQIEWNTQAFDNLVLDAGEKRLLLGFIGAKKNGQLKNFDDFVHGKGKGLILLLCGPPGTGKTLTAESVSENLKRPLYRVDASDLGNDSKKLETRLKTALTRCAHWDAILLLDEADVFLETRSSSNFVQNEMTSIFLRVLEYYKGVMILTTNRYPAIDPAFESRIDITLVFQDLDPESRAKVWYNFLVREDAKLAQDREAIGKLAKARLNGRQIKSAVKTARILAVSEKLPLAMDHLQTVVDMRKKALRLLGREVAHVLEDSD
ncbi:AAA family ATPase [Fusarium heterosporum]|uniref:AAA family ATPase n=1 Tax=Fusarium heterosporum TaxID=42747 RepID=A0A8H5TRW6_FUSHE|nr:AAA family ATPase [Fusarium heterosporum]